MSLGKEVIWKKKYEESEARRKDLVTVGKKATRDYETLRSRYNDVIKKLEVMQEMVKELENKNDTVNKVCETLYRDYQQLQTKYSVEIDALHESFNLAADWYKENRILKRQSQYLVQHVDPALLSDITNKAFEDEEFNNLLQLNKSLKTENTNLQVEINQLKLQEFESLEKIFSLEENLSEERSAHGLTQLKLKEVKNVASQFESVCEGAISELANLQDECNTATIQFKELQKKHKHVKRERAVLAHKSMLLSDVDISPEKQASINIIGELTQSFDKEREELEKEIESLKEQLINSCTQSSDESFKFYEEQANINRNKFEEASNHIKILENKVKTLEERLNSRDEVTTQYSVCPPPPPPPMPTKAKRPNKLEAFSTLFNFVDARKKCNQKSGITIDQKTAIMGKVLEEIKNGQVKLKSVADKKKSPIGDLPVIGELREVMASLRSINNSDNRNNFDDDYDRELLMCT